MQWDVFWENKDYQQATDLPATKADPKNLIAMNANHPANVKIIYRMLLGILYLAIVD